MTVQEYGPDGALNRETLFTFTSFDRSGTAAEPATLPKSADDVWYIRIE